jgi:hypothetical protein
MKVCFDDGLIHPFGLTILGKLGCLIKKKKMMMNIG